MNIQYIAISNNQKKKLLKTIPDDTILLKDDDGDLVLNVATYIAYTQEKEKQPIEELLGKESLDLNVEYIVFN